MKTQIALEDIFFDFAASTITKNTVIFSDRGLMDGKAYCSDHVWQGVLDEINENPVYLWDRRYEAVIHLVTAADGAEKFYTGENNVARYEDVDAAKIVDKKLQNAWIGHNHFHIVDN